MLIIKKYSNLLDIKKYWETVYENNKDLVNNVSFNFIRTFISNFMTKLKVFKASEGKLSFYVFNEDNRIQMILPLRDRGDKLESLYTLDYFDIVADKDLSGEKMLEYLKLLSKQESKELELNRISSFFNTYKKLCNIAKLERMNECVKIDFSNSYEDYYNKLTKHARQNLRTAYNRMSKDGVEYSFYSHFGKIDKSLAKKLQKIYLNRRVDKYKNMNFFKKILYSICDPIANVCFGLEDSFTSVLSLNAKPVAFMSGFVKDNMIMVPRLAINEKFARYSSGVVLLNETIKMMQNKGFTCLDLATGTEQYKYQMGGKSHFSYTIRIGAHNEEENKATI